MKLTASKQSLIFTFTFLSLFLSSRFLCGYDPQTGIIQKSSVEIPKPLLNIISVDMDNVPLEEALAIIAEKSQLHLNYNQNDLPVNENISIRMNNVPALKVLIKVLNDTGAELRITKGGHLIIRPQEEKKNPQGSVYGRVEEDLNKRIIPGVLVQIVNTKHSTLTNENGEYIFTHIPVGNHTLRFSLNGFKTLDKTDIIIRSNRITYVNVELEIPLMDIQETIEVIGSTYQADEKNPVSVVSVSSEEVRRAPGTGGGLLRMLKVMPGIVTSADEDTDLVVRGGSPNENGFIIDNIEIPGISHLPNLASSGGSYSALNADLIQNVKFYTGGFSSNYGGFLSAITDITLREGNRNEFDGQFNIDMAGSGFVFEGPLSKERGSWLISARKSYIYLLKDIGIIDASETISGLDAQIKVTYDITPTQKIRLLYYHLSGSEIPDDSGIRVRNLQNYAHNTAGINWTSYWSQKFFSDTSVAFSSIKNTIGENLGTLNFRDDRSIWKNDHVDLWDVKDVASTVSLRNSNYLVINNHNKFEFGLQLRHESAKLREVIHPIYESDKIHDILSPIWDDEGKWGQPQQNNFSFNTTKSGLFFSYIGTHFKKLTTIIGIRGDYSSASKRFNPAPRFSLRYRINQQLSMGGGIGIFYQTLPLAFLAYIPGANGLKDMRATHYTLGLEWLLGRGAKITLEAYIKDYKYLPISPDARQSLAIDHTFGRYRSGFWSPVGYRVPKTLVDEGSGSSHGIELLIQKKLVDKFYGFLSASYFRSRYKDLLGQTHNRIYDNRFTFNLCLGYKPTQTWEFSAKWTVFGGGPYTPIDVETSTQLDRWILDDTKVLQSRYPAYNSLCLRVDKHFYFKKSSLTIFLDVWNVLNSKNVLYYWFTRWWEEIPIRASYQMETLPILGIEFKF